jgi:hypothetical protein
MADFTATQGRYLAFIHAYTSLRGIPPAEAEIVTAMCVSPPSVNQMVKMLEKKGLILRQPGQPRSLRVLVPDDEIPQWNHRRRATDPTHTSAPPKVPAATPAKLYVIAVYLMSGPVGKTFANKQTSRVLEIRGDQTLEELHHAIFKAYDRCEEHQYEFQFGKRPFDPGGPNYGVLDRPSTNKGRRDARNTTLDDLDLKPNHVFGYWFDFGDNWFHELQVHRVEQAIATVTYPRVIKRVGKSPPQYGGG